MNMQGFPRDFLLRLKPELEQGESGAIALSMGIRPPNSSEGGFLIMSPRSTDELGVVEIVRIELSAHDAGLVGSAAASPKSFCEFDGKNRSAEHC